MEEIPAEQIRNGTIDSSVNLNHCLFCNSSCTNNLNKNEWLSSSLSPLPGSSHLEASVFILRILLEIPQNKLTEEHLINILDNSSLSSSWLTICDQCSKAVGQAQVIYKDILESTRRFRSVQQEIVENLVRSSERDRQPIIDDDDIKTDKCREFVKGYNYTDFGYPITVHNAESLSQLEVSTDPDQMEFTDIFQVKPEPDEQEMQFILPEDQGQTEDKETQVNDLSFPSVVSSKKNGIQRKKEYRCITCNKVFNNRQNLFVHNDKYHKADPRRTCEFCGRVLANSATYTRHKKNNCSRKKGNEGLVKEGGEKGISTEDKCGSCNKKN